MKKISSIQLFVYLLVWMLLASCAQVVPPGGGPVDKTAPRALKYLPDSAKLNFDARSMEIVFDEYIVLKDLSSQLIISPPLEYSPEISAKNKTLRIELDKKEVLKPNTTYSIHFGTAIQDLNENNPKENFSYLFSTGNFIDSLVLQGQIKNAFDHKTEKGILIMLYKNSDDSVVYKSLPDYFSRTKQDGTFEIRNIATGDYKIFALKDGNSNYKYDSGETIAFSDSLVNPSSKRLIKLNAFTEPEGKIYLKKYTHDQYGKFVLIFSSGSDSIQVSNVSNDQKGVQEIFDYSKNRDTLVYWVKNFQKDSLSLQVNNGSKILDTVSFKFIKLEDALKAKRNPLKLRMLTSPDGNQSFNLNSALTLTFSQPVTAFSQEQKTILMEDTLLHSQNDHIGFNSDSGASKQVVSVGLWDSTTKAEPPQGIVYAPSFNSILPLKENTKYELYIPPETFTDFFGLKNDSIRIKFRTREQKYYGSVNLKLDVSETGETTTSADNSVNGGNKLIPAGSERNYIVQLLDEKENVIRENKATASAEFVYEYLQPGKYKLKIIFDENGNGKWDEGNYRQKKQPEQVIYNSETINIRSNWDADLEWKVN